MGNTFFIAIHLLVIACPGTCTPHRKASVLLYFTLGLLGCNRWKYAKTGFPTDICTCNNSNRCDQPDRSSLPGFNTPVLADVNTNTSLVSSKLRAWMLAAWLSERVSWKQQLAAYLVTWSFLTYCTFKSIKSKCSPWRTVQLLLMHQHVSTF